MKPKPLESLNHFTMPVAMFCSSFGSVSALAYADLQRSQVQRWYRKIRIVSSTFAWTAGERLGDREAKASAGAGSNVNSQARRAFRARWRRIPSPAAFGGGRARSRSEERRVGTECRVRW